MRAVCCEATVLGHETVAQDIRLLTVRWPDRDHAPNAGQFFTLRSWAAEEEPSSPAPSVSIAGTRRPRPWVFVSGGGTGHREAGHAASGTASSSRPHGQRL